MFEDSKVVNKYCKLKKVRQYNGQKKRQRTNNCNKKKNYATWTPINTGVNWHALEG